MPIQLDWDISQAPGDTQPVPPAAPPPSGGEGLEPGGPAALRRRRITILLLLALGLAASLGVAAMSRRGWAEMRGQVVALVKLEEELARAGDIEALLAIQDPADAGWRIVRAQLARNRLPAAMMLSGYVPAGEQLVIRNLEAIHRDVVVADVQRAYLGSDGRLRSFHGPQFYRRTGENGWIRVAPPASFWQEPGEWESPQLHILYQTPDAEVAADLGTTLSQSLEEDCARLELDCEQALPVRLWLSSDPVYSLPTGWEESLVHLQIGASRSASFELPAQEVFLAVPSPQFGQLPADEGSRAALLDYLTAQVSRLLAEKLYGNTPQAQEVLRQMLFSDGALEPPANANTVQNTPMFALDPGRQFFRIGGLRFSPPETQRQTPSGSTLTWSVTGLYDLGALESAPGQTEIRYVVRRYDTLDSIAQKFGIHRLAILAVNPRIADPGQITPGMTILVPLPPADSDD